MKRDSINKENALKIIQSQISIEKKKELSHFIINNDKSDLKCEVENFVKNVFEELS